MAITYGMSVKEFWEDSPDLFWAYRFSYFERLKVNQEEINFKSWLQGAYFYEAISVALCNSFTKQKVKYVEKPYDLTPKEEKNENDKSKQLEIKIKNRISQMQKIIGQSTKEEGKGGDTNE